MSQSVQQFMDRVREDTGLREQVMMLGQDMQGIMNLAKNEGYTFTQQDFVAALKEKGYEVGGELSEADLAQVAGGTGMAELGDIYTEWPTC